MFRFFRNIRKTLLAEGKTSRYLKYAIGEILLVMIGILLALQVNNWNERRKQQENLEKIYAIIKSDLESDCASIDRVFEQMASRKPYFTKVLNGTMTLSDYQDCVVCKYLITGYPDILLQTRGINLLKNIGYASFNRDDELFHQLSEFYQEYSNEIEIDLKAIESSFNGTLTHWINNYDWYSDLAMKIENPAYIDYMMNSPDYKNRIADFYWVFYEIYLPKLIEYKEKAEEFILEINERIDN